MDKKKTVEERIKERRERAAALEAERQVNIAWALGMKDGGATIPEIAQMMGQPISTIRAWTR